MEKKTYNVVTRMKLIHNRLHWFPHVQMYHGAIHRHYPSRIRSKDYPFSKPITFVIPKP